MLDHGVNAALSGSLEPILYVEREAFCAANLAWQMEQGFMDEAPVWSDVKSITGSECGDYLRERLCEERLELLIGGIPCQPWSEAGKKRGADDERDLWPATLKIVKTFEPRIVFIENVAGLLREPMGGERIERDLRDCGCQVTAGLFSSEEMGASQQRKRCFIMAYRKGEGLEGGRQSEYTIKKRQPRLRCDSGIFSHYAPGRDSYRSWAIVASMDQTRMPALEREFCRVVDGVAGWVDRIRAVGNGVDPLVAAIAFVTLWATLCDD